jgi:DNA-binding LacI/PurR family transcriptional regulator
MMTRWDSKRGPGGVANPDPGLESLALVTTVGATEPFRILSAPPSEPLVSAQPRRSRPVVAVGRFAGLAHQCCWLLAAGRSARREGPQCGRHSPELEDGHEASRARGRERLTSLCLTGGRSAVTLCNRLQEQTLILPVQTIADIARIAGVSKATVSRALNDSPLVSAPTKERIHAIAREHRFQMNVTARRLSTRRSHAIAFVTYTYKAGLAVPDAFMLELQSGVSSALHALGYDLLVVHVGAHETDWAGEYLESGRADGFVLLNATCTKNQLKTLVELKAPFVIWGAPPGAAYSTVIGDNVTGGRLATEHLLRSGKRRIAFLGGYEGDHEVEDRRRGYELAFEAFGLPALPEFAAYSHWTEESGRAAMTELLERGPDLDAVFACSDVLAIAALDVLRERGRDVPGQVGVVGYDDIAVARFCNPPLTTVRQNGPLAGRLLAEHLVQRLQTGVVTNVSIPAELVVRESA